MPIHLLLCFFAGPPKPQSQPHPQTIHNNNSPASNNINYMTTKRESNDTQLKCQSCDEILSSTEELNNHTKRHNLDNRKHFKCNLCGKSYTQSSSLGFHKRKIHQNEIKKEEISPPSQQPSSYGSTEIFNQIYECHRCNKQFSRPSSLKQHYLIHKEIKVRM